MSKKLGKFLLFTAAAGSAAAAAVYYYMQKRDARKASEDDDYDNFTVDEDKASEASPHYVPLTPDPADANETKREESGQTDAEPTESSQEKTPLETAPPEQTPDPDPQSEDFHFTPLSKQIFQAEEKTEETVENFFGEDSADTDSSSGK